MLTNRFALVSILVFLAVAATAHHHHHQSDMTDLCKDPTIDCSFQVNMSTSVPLDFNSFTIQHILLDETSVLYSNFSLPAQSAQWSGTINLNLTLAGVTHDICDPELCWMR